MSNKYQCGNVVEEHIESNDDVKAKRKLGNVCLTCDQLRLNN